MSSLQKRV